MTIKEYFVTAIGTDIGKSFLVENLCRNSQEIIAIKPIASGFCDDDENSDSARILKSLSLPINSDNLNKISPWRFVEAVSPHFAAEKLGTEINFLEVVNFCRQKISLAQNENKTLLIEAAGGVMTPINFQKSFLDLASELQIPILLVTANYLGSISHTLSAIKALESCNLQIAQIIINENCPLFPKSPNSIIKTLKDFSGHEVANMEDFLKNFLDKKIS